jgi:hypothetical protein
MTTLVWDTQGMTGDTSGRDFSRNTGAAVMDWEYVYQVVNKAMPLANFELNPNYSNWAPTEVIDGYYLDLDGRSYYGASLKSTINYDNWIDPGSTFSASSSPTTQLHGTQVWRFKDSYDTKINLQLDYIGIQWPYWIQKISSNTYYRGRGTAVRIRPLIESAGAPTQYTQAMNTNDGEHFWPLFDPLAGTADGTFYNLPNKKVQGSGHISYSNDHCFVTMPNIEQGVVVPGFFVGRGVKSDGTIEPERIVFGAQRGANTPPDSNVSWSYYQYLCSFGIQNFQMFAIDHTSRRMAYSPSHPLMITEQGPHKSDMVIYPTIPLFPGTLDQGSTTPWFVNGWARDMTFGDEFQLQMNGATRTYKTVSVGGAYHGQYNAFNGWSLEGSDWVNNIHFSTWVSEERNDNNYGFLSAHDPKQMATAILWE